MKLTTAVLKKLIREELNRINEEEDFEYIKGTDNEYYEANKGVGIQDNMLSRKGVDSMINQYVVSQEGEEVVVDASNFNVADVQGMLEIAFKELNAKKIRYVNVNQRLASANEKSGLGNVVDVGAGQFEIVIDS